MKLASLVTVGLLLLSGGACASREAIAAEAIPNPATQAHTLDKVDLEAWVDGLVPYALDSGDIAGGVVAVVKGGAILFAKGYGYSDIATHKPVDADKTLFRPGSVSKLFTWTAVMQMVEQGKLDLDRDVNTYLDF